MDGHSVLPVPRQVTNLLNTVDVAGGVMKLKTWKSGYETPHSKGFLVVGLATFLVGSFATDAILASDNALKHLGRIVFADQILPIFREHCLECHGHRNKREVCVYTNDKMPCEVEMVDRSSCRMTAKRVASFGMSLVKTKPGLRCHPMANH